MKFGMGSNTERTQKYTRVKVQNDIHTVGDTEKFRIPFHRTAVARLKNGENTVRRLLKNSRSVRPRYRFNLSRSPYVSLKKI